MAFLAQNICYVMALDFAVWNLTMEGLCKTMSSKPKRNMGRLGTNSGIMLLIKAVRQGRPWKVSIFLWLFWLQACVLRGLALLFIINLEFDKYDPNSNAVLTDFNGDFWVGWIFITFVITVPLFVLWIFVAHQAPVSDQDGWRWATIARTALHGHGNYGVRNNVACWGKDVGSFSDWIGIELA
jgi:hypothetical protein